MANIAKQTLDGFSNRTPTPINHRQAFRVKDIAEAVSGGTVSQLCLRGRGLSYGDASLLDGHTDLGRQVLSLQALDRIYSADWETGVVVVEPGITIREVMRLSLPHGWMLPTTPGYSEISIGGALAFDIHGKNHRQAGGFSRCTRRFELMLPSGETLNVTRESEPELFQATVGGMGMTGVILALELQLSPLPGAEIKTEKISFTGLPALIEALQSDKATDADYVVSWIDLLNCAGNIETAKAALIVSNWTGQAEASSYASENWLPRKAPPLKMIAPFFNTFSNQIVNRALASFSMKTAKPKPVPLRSHLFSWDTLASWNNLYGKQGFVEYQIAVPDCHAEVLCDVASRLVSSGTAIYLAAAKLLSEGEGYLSYGIKNGISILFDMPGATNLDVLDECDDMIARVGGRVHLAKDSRLKAAAFGKIFGAALQDQKDVISRVDPDGKMNSALLDRVWPNRAILDEAGNVSM